MCLFLHAEKISWIGSDLKKKFFHIESMGAAL